MAFKQTGSFGRFLVVASAAWLGAITAAPALAQGKVSRGQCLATVNALREARSPSTPTTTSSVVVAAWAQWQSTPFALLTAGASMSHFSTAVGNLRGGTCLLLRKLEKSGSTTCTAQEAQANPELCSTAQSCQKAGLWDGGCLAGLSNEDMITHDPYLNRVHAEILAKETGAREEERVAKAAADKRARDQERATTERVSMAEIKGIGLRTTRADLNSLTVANRPMRCATEMPGVEACVLMVASERCEVRRIDGFPVRACVYEYPNAQSMSPSLQNVSTIAGARLRGIEFVFVNGRTAKLAFYASSSDSILDAMVEKFGSPKGPKGHHQTWNGEDTEMSLQRGSNGVTVVLERPSLLAVQQQQQAEVEGARRIQTEQLRAKVKKDI